MKSFKIILFLITIFLIWFSLNAIMIYSYAKINNEVSADVGIVLGAGTKDGVLSNVYQARMDHAIYLLDQDFIQHLILTGGFGEGEQISDSQTAFNYALAYGIDSNQLSIEQKSKVTYENLVEAKR